VPFIGRGGSSPPSDTEIASRAGAGGFRPAPADHPSRDGSLFRVTASVVALRRALPLPSPHPGFLRTGHGPAARRCVLPVFNRPSPASPYGPRAVAFARRSGAPAFRFPRFPRTGHSAQEDSPTKHISPEARHTGI
jgi:hypothetical protein